MSLRRVVLALVGTGFVALAGCGSRPVTCDCGDGSTQKSSESSNACVQCPEDCANHGGWSGGYVYDQGPADAGPFDIGECGGSSSSGGSSTSSSGGTGSGSTSGSTSGNSGSGSSTGSSSGSSGSGASATVTGLEGFTVGDEVGATDSFVDGGRDLSYVEVDLTAQDHGDLCAATTPPLAPGEHVLIVDVERAVGALVVSGTYSTAATPFDGGRGEVIALVGNDAGSGQVEAYGSGSVTLTTVDISGTAGSFDVTFELPDAGSQSVTGSFSGIPLCHQI